MKKKTMLTSYFWVLTMLSVFFVFGYRNVNASYVSFVVAMIALFFRFSTSDKILNEDAFQ